MSEPGGRGPRVKKGMENLATPPHEHVEIPFDPDSNSAQDTFTRIDEIAAELKGLNTAAGDDTEAQTRRRALREELSRLRKNQAISPELKKLADLTREGALLSRNIHTLAENQAFTFLSVDVLRKMIDAVLGEANKNIGAPAVLPQERTYINQDELIRFQATVGEKPVEVSVIRTLASSRSTGPFYYFEIKVAPSEWAEAKAAIETESTAEKERDVKAEIPTWINNALTTMFAEHPKKWKENELDAASKMIQERIERFLRAMGFVGIPAEVQVSRTIPIASGFLGLSERLGTIDITVTKECRVTVQIIK